MSKLIAQAANLGTFKPPTSAFDTDVANPTGVGAVTSLELIISRAIGILTVLAGLFFIIYFVLGAFKWLTAGGDSGKVQKARDEMVQGVLGLIIIVASYGLVGLVGSIVGLDLLNPGIMLLQISPFSPTAG